MNGGLKNVKNKLILEGKNYSRDVLILQKAALDAGWDVKKSIVEYTLVTLRKF